VNFASKDYGIFTFLVGAFYLKGNETFEANIFEGLVPNLPPAPKASIFLQETYGRVEKEILAGYAEVTVQPSEKLFLTAGGRYTRERQRTFSNSLSGIPQPTIKEYPDDPVTFKKFTPRVTARYEVGPRTNIYASWGRGFAGGSCQNAPAYKCNTIAPEKIDAFELGYKYSTRAVSVELSGFYYDYKNLQVSAYLAGQANIINAANSKIYGIDGQVSFRLTDAISLNAGGAWTHARYKQFNNAPVYTSCSLFPAGSGANCLDPAVLNNGVTFLVIPTTLKNVTMQRTPEFTGSVGARYSTALAGGKLDLSGNLYYSSKFFFGPSGIQFPQDNYATLSLRAQWTDPDDRYTVALYGENITNSRYLTQVQYSNFGIGANWSKPVTYGIELGAKF